MIPHINGLHHVTAFAGPPRINDGFFAGTLGLRRVKVTVNFDNPHVYHLYFGDRFGTPGTVMTHFPDRKWAQGTRGTGEVGEVAFAVPRGALDLWAERVEGTRDDRFGEARLRFFGPDGETLVLVETDDDRAGWDALPADRAINGFHSVTMVVADAAPSVELLQAMGYQIAATEGAITRLAMNAPVGVIDIVHAPDLPPAVEGAGSVHHIAFATDTDDSLMAIRDAVIDLGFRPTGLRDRTYFHSIYFRTPGGILFEVATSDIGFDADEPLDGLGTTLRLPAQHERLRSELVQSLEPIDGLVLG